MTGSDDQKHVGDDDDDKIQDQPVGEDRLERREESEDIHKMWQAPSEKNRVLKNKMTVGFKNKTILI
jgi:hypothetical protein